MLEALVDITLPLTSTIWSRVLQIMKNVLGKGENAGNSTGPRSVTY